MLMRCSKPFALTGKPQHYKQQVALKFADIVYFGQWYTPLREALQAFVESTQQYRDRRRDPQAV